MVGLDEWRTISECVGTCVCVCVCVCARFLNYLTKLSLAEDASYTSSKGYLNLGVFLAYTYNFLR